MEVVCVYMHLLAARKHRNEALTRRRLARQRRRWQIFFQRQAQERIVFAFVFSLFALNLVTTPRTLWAKERSKCWWEDIVGGAFSPQDWLDNFRMSHQTFLYLCNELRTSIARSDTVMRRAISVERRVAITLWFLATNADYRTIGHLFGVSKATVCIVTKDVCAAIVAVLLPRYIKIPSGDNLREVIDKFLHKWAFPQCAEAVDGTHIPIVSPQECPADYYNRKGWHSIILQRTVNHLGHFMDVCVGWPGHVHDARVFSNSTLYKRGQEGTLLPDWKRSLSGKDVPLVILGDPAYPLLPWLMKAYLNNGYLSHDQKTFDYRLSKARVVVEHAYGRLKGRWRCLLKRLDVSVVDVQELVAACCVLHNICEVHGESFNDEWMEGVESNNDTSRTVAAGDSGQSTRQALTSYFKEH